MAEALVLFTAIKLEFTVPRKELCHSISEVVTSELQFRAVLYIGLNDKGLGLKFLGWLLLEHHHTTISAELGMLLHKTKCLNYECFVIFLLLSCDV